MAADLLHLLISITMALAVILSVRPANSRIFGAKLGYFIWFSVPLAAIVSLLPVPARDLLPVPIVYLTRPAGEAAGVLQTATWSTDAQLWLAMAWLAGAAAFAGFQALQQRAFLRRLGNLVPAPQGVYLSERFDIGPCVVGAVLPKIVLPGNFGRRYTPEELRLIIAHERTHISRKDPLINLCVLALRAILWFHPLIHIAARCFRIDQELACDAVVLALQPRSSSQYAQAILKTQLAPAGVPSGCSWESHNAAALKRRITMLTRLTISPRRRRLGVVALSATLVTVASLAWATKSHGELTEARIVKWPVDAVMEKYYPAAAAEAGVEGYVRITVTLDKAGRPTDTLVLDEFPSDQGFASAASSMAHFMEYSNPIGKPAPLTFRVKFELAGDEAPDDQIAEEVNARPVVSVDELMMINKGRKPLVLIDGNAVAPNFDIQSIEPSSIERIEVLPGNVTATYGADGTDGVINIVLKVRRTDL